MNHGTEPYILKLSGNLIIPDSMPECQRILAGNSTAMLSHYFLTENGIVVRGRNESTVKYSFICPMENIEKTKTVKFKTNFARFIAIRNIRNYSRIGLKVDIAWEDFSLIHPKQIRFYQILNLDPNFQLKVGN